MSDLETASQLQKSTNTHLCLSPISKPFFVPPSCPAVALFVLLDQGGEHRALLDLRGVVRQAKGGREALVAKKESVVIRGQ